ncbi:MAG: SGNH/GDSL hydrolase family protein [Planctomycetes bacterium]|nr:SGNH/GDSL hydrolase family protein [Planctomycetota bacterium]
MQAASLRKRLRRAAVALAVLAVVVFGLELGLRSVGAPAPQPRTYTHDHESRPSEHFVADPVLGWRMRPGTELVYGTEGRISTYRANADGFRRGEVEPSDGQVLAVLGDSFAWGAGVQFEETFGALLASTLGMRIANFGMPGYGIDQVAATLRERALPAKPTLVLVAIFASDFQRSLDGYREIEGMTKPVFRLADGELVPFTEADVPWAPWRWLDEHSFAFTAAKLASWKLAMRWPHGEWWHLNRAFLARMISDCRAAGVKLAFVHVPTISWRGFPALGEFCAEERVPWIDPVELSPTQPKGLYYVEDKHLNAAGHAWLAGLLGEHLVSAFASR